MGCSAAEAAAGDHQEGSGQAAAEAALHVPAEDAAHTAGGQQQARARPRHW